ncbi:uroporphyrin-3 C-methyltransferase [Natronospira proteinivora]|uniref:Uroporphyrin-3 C-methyltransferase n=1 Tax=Natronospira proteinivora TaxID=1807133 RepID=A0ABT1GAQ8_9GAMM|nr:uroporphyrinogen-III C-methyltransferase [Natronospira proteinivora]MCP1728127.1 uroporphyrin-3 C-methyltransferase [Natronospira proteinivora]
MTDKGDKQKHDKQKQKTPADEGGHDTASSQAAHTGKGKGAGGAESTAKTGSAPRQRAAKTGGRGAALATTLSLITIVLLAGLMAAAWWGWAWLDERLERLDALESQVQDQQDAREEQRELAQRLPRLSDQLSDLEDDQRTAERARQDLEDSIGRLDQRTESLRDFIDAGRSAWRVAEVEYLLQLANAELQLAGRHDTADAALAAADQRLAALADPGFTPVREAIARDRERLRAAEDVDISGATLTLGSLIERVPALPIEQGLIRGEAAVEQVPEDAQRWWQRLRERSSEIFSDLVTVRHDDVAVRPLLAPEQEYFLRQNLQLSLATARLALLQEQPEVWRASLDEARDWLATYFDPEDEAVIATDEALSDLAESRIRRERPDISASLERLRGIRETRD